ncbi:sensor histidine kinase [Microbacterium sp.]|uniref:sensor histidine kinase n=1 Tax=Microbacterium sp. TaxID=51671 RepID=UPI0039E72835
MDSTQAALLGLVVGGSIGAIVVLLVVLALRVRARLLVDASTEVPDGAQAVLRGLDDAAVVVDPSLVVVAASPAAEPYGMSVGRTLPGDQLRTLVHAAQEAEHPEVQLMRVQRGEGPLAESRLATARAITIAPRLTLLVIRDITERERVEQMRRDFVANTSHELKTPVGAIALLAEAISAAADDPEQVRRFSHRLQAEAGRLGSLVARVLSLSRLQSAVDPSEDRDVAVDKVVDQAIAAHAVVAEAAGVELARGGDRGVVVRGDQQVLTEAVGNLLANAIAHSPAGAVVGVGVRIVHGVVSIAVTDRGPGIPEAEQARIFERFYRSDAARSRRTGGTGLGLSIVKHAAQRHGGDVQLWSRPDHGSTFTMRLPARSESPTAPRRKKKSKKKAARSGHDRGESS